MPVIPGKNANGLTGFPTPDDTPTDTACIVIRVPADDQWVGILWGAIDALLHEYNWYEWGALTPADAAAAWNNIYQRALEDMLLLTCPPGTPTPFWDSATDVDDSYPAGELTPWYGTATVTYHSPPDVTFVEQAFIWTMAGFIAFAGQPGAAIAFLTIAPKFVLAFKTGNLGGIIDVIVDAAHIASVDTYSVEDGIQYVTVVADPGNETHQIYLVKDDNPDTTVQVVRKELSATDVTPSGVRYNVETDTFQTSPDGGTTWIDNPGADPRTNVGYQLPARTGGDPRCDAAANMTAKIKSIIDYAIATTTQIELVSGIIGIIALFFPPIALVIELVWALAELVAFIGLEVVAGAFTTEVYDRITCELYAQLDANGQLDQDGYNAFLVALDASDPGTVYNVAKAVLDQMGFVGLNNAGATGEETGDCSACETWCLVCDFTSIDGGFSVQFGGAYSGGTGWQPTDVSNYRDLEIARTLGATFHVTEIGMEFDFETGNWNSGSLNSWAIWAGLGSYFTHGVIVDHDHTTNGTGRTLALTLDNDIDRLYLEIVTDTYSGAHVGSATLLNLTMRGTGTKPTLSGWTDCP